MVDLEKFQRYMDKKYHYIFPDKKTQYFGSKNQLKADDEKI